MVRVGCGVVLITLACLGSAWRPIAFGQAAQGLGTVTGHVVLADSNLPARLASVVLVPAVEAPVEAKEGAKPVPTPPRSIVQTLLDGSFAFGGVQPGNYYVVAEEAGYLSPLSEFTREQINKPDEATARKMAQLMPLVTVTAGHLATAEVKIYRAGSISGTVRFDDGSPFAGADVQLMAKDKDGKWKDFSLNRINLFNASGTSDDEGVYRLVGIPPGEYLVRTPIHTMSVMVSNLFGSGSTMSNFDGDSLEIYGPNAVRQKDAKSVKVGEGEAVGSVDLEVPVSTMHTVSGAIIDAAGAPINAGTATLSYTDDGTEVATAKVSKEDSQFHFNFVPEGSYTLKATKVREVRREEIANPPGTMPPSQTKETTIRQYNGGSIPLIVNSNLTGVMVKVDNKPVTAKDAANGSED